MSVDKGLSQESDNQLALDREKVANDLWTVGRKRKELEDKYSQLEQERHGPRANDHQLAAEREKVRNDLSAARAEHKDLEDKYNQIEKERFVRQGEDPDTYKYKHDARHEFQFKENKATGEKRATMAERPDGSGPYTLRKKDEVINWRSDTEIGARESAKAQQRAAGRTGDDAGHLVGAEFGADPADPGNLTRQHLAHNETGAWYNQERQLREEVEQGRQCGVEVRVKPQGDRSSRTMETFDVSVVGKRSEAQGGNVEHVDFSTYASRGYQEGKPSRGEALQARKDTHAHAAEVTRAIENRDPEEVREWQRMKEDRRGLGARVVRSGPPSRDDPPERTDQAPIRAGAANKRQRMSEAHQPPELNEKQRKSFRPEEEPELHYFPSGTRFYKHADSSATKFSEYWSPVEPVTMKDGTKTEGLEDVRGRYKGNPEGFRDHQRFRSAVSYDWDTKMDQFAIIKIDKDQVGYVGRANNQPYDLSNPNVTMMGGDYQVVLPTMGEKDYRVVKAPPMAGTVAEQKDQNETLAAQRLSRRPSPSSKLGPPSRDAGPEPEPPSPSSDKGRSR